MSWRPSRPGDHEAEAMRKRHLVDVSSLVSLDPIPQRLSLLSRLEHRNAAVEKPVLTAHAGAFLVAIREEVKDGRHHRRTDAIDRLPVSGHSRDAGGRESVSLCWLRESVGGQSARPRYYPLRSPRLSVVHADVRRRLPRSILALIIGYRRLIGNESPRVCEAELFVE